MLSVVVALLQTFHTSFRSRAALHLEILALRHQLHVLQRSRPRHIRLTRPDRWLWVWLSHVWAGWRTAAVLVKPATVVAWHRRGFRLFWTWKSRPRLGRPTVPPDVRALIRTMSQANPLWGAPRIHGELLKNFFVVPTATGRLLFVLVILAHHRRRVVHVAVTAHPTAAWTAQQLREAFPVGRRTALLDPRSGSRVRASGRPPRRWPSPKC